MAPEVRELSRRLLPESDELGARMAERICAEIPLYAEGAVVSEFSTHSTDENDTFTDQSIGRATKVVEGQS